MPTAHDLRPLLDVQQNQLNLVFSDSDAIDSKALAVLGANVAILLFIDQAAPHLVLWKFLTLYGPFMLSLVMDVMSVWPRQYKSAAPDLKKSPDYLTMDTGPLILQILSNTQAAIEHNARLNKKRLQACIVSILLTSLGFIGVLLIL
ncbi:MAG TPA: hypothetical protein VGS08_01270 [Candidatus Saccharimonadales bacterium]|nr:hypothetical protein [Candidatus Saccharimonadales bacterium]